jgi:hypothetical protein
VQQINNVAVWEHFGVAMVGEHNAFALAGAPHFLAQGFDVHGHNAGERLIKQRKNGIGV